MRSIDCVMAACQRARLSCCMQNELASHGFRLGAEWANNQAHAVPNTRKPVNHNHESRLALNDKGWRGRERTRCSRRSAANSASAAASATSAALSAVSFPTRSCGCVGRAVQHAIDPTCRYLDASANNSVLDYQVSTSHPHIALLSNAGLRGPGWGGGPCSLSTNNIECAKVQGDTVDLHSCSNHVNQPAAGVHSLTTTVKQHPKGNGVTTQENIVTTGPPTTRSCLAAGLLRRRCSCPSTRISIAFSRLPPHRFSVSADSGLLACVRAGASECSFILKPSDEVQHTRCEPPQVHCECHRLLKLATTSFWCGQAWQLQGFCGQLIGTVRSCTPDQRHRSRSGPGSASITQKH